MEIFDLINGMVSAVGVSGVILVMWAIMPILILISMSTVFISVQKQSKKNERTLIVQLEGLTNAISLLSAQVQEPPLSVGDSLDYFYLVMNSHVLKKLRYLGDILDKNSIQERKEQIMKNIDKEFSKITAIECEKLSKKKTCAGDMGQIIHEVIVWEEFIDEVFAIFFKEYPENITQERKNALDHLKIKDIETHIYSIVDKIAEKIKNRGVHN